MTRMVTGDATEFPCSVRLHDGAAHHAYCHNTTLTVTTPRLLSQHHTYCHNATLTVTTPRLLSQRHAYCHNTTLTVTTPRLLSQRNALCHNTTLTVTTTRLLVSQHHAYCHNEARVNQARELQHLGCDQMLITPTSLKKSNSI